MIRHLDAICPRDQFLLMTILRLSFIFITLLFMSGCSDTVKNSYSTRADAEADGLFERGWLPTIIPVSSRDITTKNNLDLNFSEGEFFFPPDQATKFFSQLRKMSPSEISGTDSVRFLERDYWPYSYSDKDSHWIFFVNPEKGHCEYRMAQMKAN